MKRLVVLLAFGGSLLGVGAAPAAAHEIAPSPAFGEHVSDMAPEHPLAHAAMFGECVRTMATGGDCPHE